MEFLGILPMEQLTGFPPKVEKYPPNDSEISRVQMTAAIGWPLPKGLPTLSIKESDYYPKVYPPLV